MALEKQLSDTDSVYCTKVTNSNQTSIFISNLGTPELEALFGADCKSDDEVRLCLNKRNLAFSAVAHVVDGRTWYKRKSNEAWAIDGNWLNERLAALEKAFANGEGIFTARLNKDDRSTQRLYLKGVTSLSREDGGADLALRDFLFSGDIVVLTKLPDDSISFEVKIPDNPIVEHCKKVESPKAFQRFSHQLIVYGAPGTGKSHGIEKVVGAHGDTMRTTFHPDSDYASFVGCYKPTMKAVPRTMMAGETIKRVTNGDSALLTEDKIAYSFVPQAFTKAYVRAWQKMAQDMDGDVAPQFLVIEEINRGNCAQIFGDLFQLLDRDENGYSKYPIEADADLARHVAKELGGADAQERVPPIAGGRDGGNSGADAQERVPPIASGRDGGNSEADAQERVPPEVRSGNKLVLPPNLYIYATMNTSDQSLFPMDSAFKRRWEWKYIPIRNAGEDNPRACSHEISLVGHERIL